MDDRIPFLSSRERRWFTAREGGLCTHSEGFMLIRGGLLRAHEAQTRSLAWLSSMYKQ